MKSAGIGATIVIPPNEAWKGKRVILTVGAADFFCRRSGATASISAITKAAITPFEFDLTDALSARTRWQAQRHARVPGRRSDG